MTRSSSVERSLVSSLMDQSPPLLALTPISAPSRPWVHRSPPAKSTIPLRPCCIPSRTRSPPSSWARCGVAAAEATSAAAHTPAISAPDLSTIAGIDAYLRTLPPWVLRSPPAKCTMPLRPCCIPFPTRSPPSSWARCGVALGGGCSESQEGRRATLLNCSQTLSRTTRRTWRRSQTHGTGLLLWRGGLKSDKNLAQFCHW
ncbi:uncharacterized protein EV422DRAFT_79103 [Fimicolochytrium jonesii]|uniref:uncharacterized protein n=1 Tax=Fimicolochytrium jonesii TaxID=1396493 RepID=UPI0022FDFA1D|nr:uncharacterized protein EV422DRAFT_79103 [Fimicolochytrium jonesii]KAI8820105.1 hypothetical protein EV422DRAFT_79103 [Fimicolochytrium jonesii]